jgi:hypothetical protein
MSKIYGLEIKYNPSSIVISPSMDSIVDRNLRTDVIFRRHNALLVARNRFLDTFYR